MNVNTLPAPEENKIVALPTPPRRKARQLKEPFRIVAFINPRTDTPSWRVTGFKRDGTRIRENYADQTKAEARKLALATEWLSGHAETGMQATKLSPDQVRQAESAFLLLGPDNAADLIPAVNYWLKHGKANEVKESERLDEAFKQFKEWLEKTDEMRDLSKANLRRRVNVFTNSVPNHYVADFTPDSIADYLAKRTISAKSKDNDRRALSRFFAWCVGKKWLAMNPARKQTKSKRAVAGEIAVLSVDDCKKLLAAAEAHKEGALAPYVAVCLFGGLRPFEASRLQWSAVNLNDGEITLEAAQTKTARRRVVKIGKTLAAWLKAYKNSPFYPKNWRRDFDIIKEAAGYRGRDDEKLKAWPVDVMRHTAISHYFRDCGSYGETAEQFGNSEAIIKNHYQGKVNTKDTRKFYRLMPKKGDRK